MGEGDGAWAGRARGGCGVTFSEPVSNGRFEGEDGKAGKVLKGLGENNFGWAVTGEKGRIPAGGRLEGFVTITTPDLPDGRG